MKNSYRIILVLAAALPVLGCTKIKEDIQSDYSIRLECIIDGVKLTKADTQPGEDALNENLIKTVDYFIYPEGSTGSNATLIGHIAPNALSTTSIEVALSVDMFRTLFPDDGNKCEVYAIANLPEGTDIPANTTVSDLNDIVISASFKENAVQESFVMKSTGEIQRSGNKAGGSIGLKRVASKFTLQTSVAKKYVEARPEGNIVWTSLPGTMTVVMKNYAGKGNVEGNPGAADEIGNYDSRTFTAVSTPGSETFTKHKVENPWYSYPREWTDASDATFLLITLPWSRPSDPSDPDEGTKYQKCYYKVLLNEDEVGSNNWYNIVAELKILGSFYEDSPTQVLPDDLHYSVLEWRDGIAESQFNTDAAVKNAGYLTVSSNSYELDNVNSIAIPYSSSEECDVRCECKYNRYNGSSWTYTTLPSSNYSISCVDGFINLTHNLKNTMPEGRFSADEFDLSEFEFTIELFHKNDEANYKEVITVTQRPALVIDYVTNDKDPQDNKTTIFVNGRHDQVKNWYNVTNNDYNGNMYRVKVSRTDDYIIGDPRSTTPFSGAELGMGGTDETAKFNPRSTEAPAFYKGGNYYSSPNAASRRRLQHYYPTNTDHEYATMMAPVFRFASANSNCNSYYSTQDQVRWRCATYQEFGYPAGRWRVPTAAELKYVGRLCASGVIPSIFSNDGYYWAADGVYQYKNDGTLTLTTDKVSDDDTSKPGALSRCVYDEWYWGQSEYGPLTDATTPTYANFVWGDMPRENFK